MLNDMKMLTFYSCLIAFFVLYTPVQGGDEWHAVTGSYYELTTYYSVREYHPLRGGGDALFTGIHLRENNGIIGTYLLTLAVSRQENGDMNIEGTSQQGETDFYFYFSGMGGTVGGFDWDFYLGAFELPFPLTFKMGMGLGLINGVYKNDRGDEGKWYSFKLGLPLRLVWHPWQPYVRIAYDIDANLLALFSRDRARSCAQGDEIVFAPMASQLTVTVTPHQRFLMYGGVMLPNFDEGFMLGMHVGLGIRF